jgi:large subunit ribosomal protein L4
MASIPMLNAEGREVGTLQLPDAVFGAEYNPALVHQAIVAEEANQRQGTHNTKQRHAVRGGGRKPWRQKGTGRARQGTIRAPQWRGGGVVFGPHPRDYRKAFPVKMRRGAMRSVLSEKVREGNVVGLEALQFSEIKTKQAIALLKALNLAETRHVLIVISEYNETLRKSMRNLESKGVELRFAPNFSVRDALVANKIIIVQDAVAKIEAVWTPDRAKEGNAALGSHNGNGSSDSANSAPETVGEAAAVAPDAANSAEVTA